MGENLKTVSTLTQLLVVVGATVLVFLITPSNAARYDTAIAELNRLREFVVDRESGRSGARSESPAKRILDKITAKNDALESSLQGLGVTQFIDSALLDQSPASFLRDTTIKTPVPEMYFAVQLIADMEVYRFDRAELAAMVATANQEIDQPAVEPDASDADRAAAKEAGLFWRRVDVTAVSPSLLDIELVGGDNDADSRLVGSVAGHRAGGFADELQHAGLCDGNGRVLPALSAFVPDLHDSPLDVARLNLELRKAEDRSSIEVMGLTADSRTVAAIAPMVMLVLLARLMVELEYLARNSFPLPRDAADLLELRGAWTGLHPSPRALWGSIVAVWIPVLIAVVLLGVSTRSFNPLTGVGIAAAVCSAWCAHRCSRLALLTRTTLGAKLERALHAAATPAAG